MAGPSVDQPATRDGLIASLVSGNAVIIGALLIVVFFANTLLAPRMDPSEPPLVKPSIPLIGHIIGIIRQQNAYHYTVRRKHPLPAASLQMLWGKMYAIWDPVLAQSALRAPGLSAEALFTDFVEKSFGLKPETLAKIKENEKLLVEWTSAAHSSMQPNQVYKMNVIALDYISRTLDEVCPRGDSTSTFEAPNLYIWLRDIITLATTDALYGKANPFENDPKAVEAIWEFEDRLSVMVTDPLAWLTQKKGFLARDYLQALLSEYYVAEHDLKDPDVAGIVKDRAALLRKYGFPSQEIGAADFMAPVIAVTNTAPTMFWMFCYVFSRPDLVERLRDELLPAVQRSNAGGAKDTALINVAALEDQCPLLIACSREILRLLDHSVGARVVAKDTTITDGEGRSYLLKEGVRVQICSGPAHRLPDVWGKDVDVFNPDRFLDDTSAAKDKARKTAYIPFGGGKHYCPGRYFANAEILSLTSALVMGFEAEPVGMPFDKFKRETPVFTNAVVKPHNGGLGLGLRLKRRKGWESTRWTFEI